MGQVVTRTPDSRPTAEPAAPAPIASSPDEAALLVRLRAGEDAAYRELLNQQGGRLLSVARRLLRDEDDARDCLQDAFLSAFRAIDRFEGQAKLGTWLHRIVVNACLMRLRSRKRHPEDLIDPQLPELDQYGFRIGPTEMTAATADELLERKEVRREVREAIDALPEGYRTVLVLRDIEELDTAETAELLEVTPGAVKTRLHRARVALRDQIGSLFE